MKLKLREIKIATGGPLIGLVNIKDAELLDLHKGDRIKLRARNKSIVVKIDITESELPAGCVGLFQEAYQKFGTKNNTLTSIELSKKPESIKYIKEKLLGKKLSEDKINLIISDIVDNRLDDIELTYFVSACHTMLMDYEETTNLTKAMIKYGDTLSFDTDGPIVDKHCVGGVAGNRTTMIVVPIVAAAGLTMPKTSSRSITSPAGTADTMECIANVSFDVEEITKIIKHVGACIVWGGAINLAPADDRIIRVEHPLSIDSRSQLVASILAKKASVSSTHVVVDIPLGKGAKVEDRENAQILKEQFINIGKRVGMHIEVVITDGSAPIGRGFGANLEARDVLAVLENDPDAPKDLKDKSLMLAGKIFEMTKISKKGQGKVLAKKILNSGRAYQKFVQMAEAQNVKTLDRKKLRKGKFRRTFRAKVSGKVNHIDNTIISKIARLAGAPHDAGAGILLYTKKGNRVKKGEKLFTVYSNNRQRLRFGSEVEVETPAIIIQ